MSQFCVLVASSDSRRDIFDICFANADHIWADCDWPKYIGVNSAMGRQNFRELVAPAADNWCEQVRRYVHLLPPDISYILLMVEDCLFMKPVDGTKLDGLAKEIAAYGLSYLRLVPIVRNLTGRIWDKMHEIPRVDSCPFQLIPPNEPYYSSTEMALWRRDYLLAQLDNPSDAWSFEHLAGGRSHWAVLEPVFEQHQIVHKGKWHRRAAIFLAEAWFGYPDFWRAREIEYVLRAGGRPMQSFRSFLRGEWQNVNFALFGWTSFRLKRLMGIVKP